MSSWTELDRRENGIESNQWLTEIVSILTLDKRMGELAISAVPPVRRQGRVLSFRPGGPLRRAPNSRRLLYQFARLTDATILDFAQRWGPLGFCKEHRLPVLHKGGLAVCLPYRRRDEFAESISTWLRLIARVKGTLSIRAALARGRIGSARDWRILLGDSEPLPTSIDQSRATLALSVSGFLLLANVRPIVFPEPQLTIGFGGFNVIDVLVLRGDPAHEQYRDWLTDSGTLLANIAIQLALAVTGGPGFITCDACENLYQPSRAPRTGERHFCPRCGKKAAYRIAKRIDRGDSKDEALAKERRQP
jgi:hypothetical protein